MLACTVPRPRQVLGDGCNLTRRRSYLPLSNQILLVPSPSSRPRYAASRDALSRRVQCSAVLAGTTLFSGTHLIRRR
ncbi:hypothetical protein LZ31DRAFT_64583 [Colletotrichum somersetense]|nr:hypothetical protein LZ31DRAFT_64583 [Colletotrichum somersetense]